MPLDRTHQHISTSIMREGAPQTPIDPSGGSGIPQGGPLTEPLDADGFGINGVASITGDAGGPLALTASGGAAGLTGQALNLSGGDGDDGNDAAASLTLNPGDGAGNPGVAAINASALTLNGSPVGGIPQGGPLTEALDADGQDIINVGHIEGETGDAISIGSVLHLNDNAITNLADPTDPQGAATKAYVDANAVAALVDPGNVWEAETAVAPGYRILGGADEEKVFEAIGAGGTTGTEEPDFDAVTPGSTTEQDGDMFWLFIGFIGGLPFGVLSQPVSANLAVRTAAGVPSGAPQAGEAPFAFDTTAVTGGFYYWNGAAWVKVAEIL